ncbi:hypothetical protein AVEN_113874-1 [Araneus ventricosus]|uniref:Uncharacterized protein n=1 Tax=Araneus ventricosus TaxID=182803 RepID=A0A4Y2PWX9_ARAVE|nr:hypothetical protein AVEN_113874-1 [Araneus ventricosus]
MAEPNTAARRGGCGWPSLQARRRRVGEDGEDTRTRRANLRYERGAGIVNSSPVVIARFACWSAHAG